MKMITNGKLALAGTRGMLQIADADAPAIVPWYRAGGAPTPIAAYQAKGAASLAASYVNLVNPGTNNLTAPSAAPTLDSAGWVFDGTSQYLLLSVYFKWYYTMICQFSNMTNNGYLMGVFSGYAIQPNRTGNVHRWAGQSTVNVSPAYTQGNFCMVSNARGYINGSIDTSYNFSDAPLQTDAVYYFPIGAANVSGSVSQFCACKIQAVAFYTKGLSADEVSNVAAAMAAL